MGRSGCRPLGTATQSAIPTRLHRYRCTDDVLHAAAAISLPLSLSLSLSLSTASVIWISRMTRHSTLLAVPAAAGTALLRFCPAAADEPEVSEGGAAATPPQPAAPPAAAGPSSPVSEEAATSAGEADAAEGAVAPLPKAAPLATVGEAELSLLDRRVRVEITGSQNCAIVGEPQSVLLMTSSMIFTRTRIYADRRLSCLGTPPWGRGAGIGAAASGDTGAASLG
eukprot:COSAG01_NODE_4321_length_5134_cov_3.912612_1_plen_224_part_10